MKKTRIILAFAIYLPIFAIVGITSTKPNENINEWNAFKDSRAQQIEDTALVPGIIDLTIKPDRTITVSVSDFTNGTGEQEAIYATMLIKDSSTGFPVVPWLEDHDLETIEFIVQDFWYENLVLHLNVAKYQKRQHHLRYLLVLCVHHLV